MAPSVPAVAAQLRQLIFYHLDLNSAENALFFADRLQAVDPKSGDAAHLVALSLFRLGRFQAAFDASKEKGAKGLHLGCAHVFALACLQLDRYLDGVTALKDAKPLWDGRSNWNKHSDSTRRSVPDAAAIYSLLGSLYRRNKDVVHAKDAFVSALKLNPFMWDAHKALCEIGIPLKVDNIFKLSPDMVAAVIASSSINQSGVMPTHFAALSASQAFDPASPTSSTHDPFSLDTSGHLDGSGRPQSLLSRFKSASSSQTLHSDYELSQSQLSADDVSMDDAGLTSSTVSRKSRSRAGGETESSGFSGLMSRSKSILFDRPSGSPDVERSSHRRTNSAMPTPTAEPTRRSARLQDKLSKLSRKSKPTDGPEESKVGSRMAASSTAMPPPPHMGHSWASSATTLTGSQSMSFGKAQSTSADMAQSANIGSFELEALQWLLDLVCRLGSGYYHLYRYECPESLECFNSIPDSQRNTAWVLSQIAKAEYEHSNYQAAKETFVRVRKLAPSRIDDMEIFSAVLWLQKDEIGLAHLSHELVEFDRLAPQSWLALGNSFSLQRDHDLAILCFRRASQLDPTLAYAFTLQGHEHTENEEFEKAESAYRRAIHADSRHYHAWYGLGRIYERLGQFRSAEKHYRNAAQINPSNAVLAVRIGIVLQKQNRLADALDQYSAACELDRRPQLSQLARFHKARALLELGRNTEALEDLKILRDIAPETPNVHYSLGIAYKKTGNPRAAANAFTTALSFDPRAANLIKKQLEDLDQMEAMYDPTPMAA